MAWRVLEAVGDGAYADLALERELKRRNLSPRDRGLATELAYGAIRQRRRLDAWLDRLGKVPAAKQPPRLRWLLHVGLQQMLADGPGAGLGGGEHRGGAGQTRTAAALGAGGEWRVARGGAGAGGR